MHAAPGHCSGTSAGAIAGAVALLTLSCSYSSPLATAHTHPALGCTVHRTVCAEADLRLSLTPTLTLTRYERRVSILEAQKKGEDVSDK